MDERRSKTGLLIGLFLLGSVLFNYPILTLFNQHVTLFGIPLLYLYLFTIWSVLIVAIMLITKIRAHSSGPETSSTHGASDPVDRDHIC